MIRRGVFWDPKTIVEPVQVQVKDFLMSSASIFVLTFDFWHYFQLSCKHEASGDVEKRQPDREPIWVQFLPARFGALGRSSDFLELRN
ncbi:unnamed protein product [Caenorhabditis auriculariae]|uniref:Uncharacterized protein n=1 Tax=Caenorhabditis auriculariae TaxID=2777116 RepID=A0A8S1H216_9PELO|nr:unnamed protein product [Caenorhabditis auriculariae]